MLSELDRTLELPSFLKMVCKCGDTGVPDGCSRNRHGIVMPSPMDKDLILPAFQRRPLSQVKIARFNRWVVARENRPLFSAGWHDGEEESKVQTSDWSHHTMQALSIIFHVWDDCPIGIYSDDIAFCLAEEFYHCITLRIDPKGDGCLLPIARVISKHREAERSPWDDYSIAVGQRRSPWQCAVNYIDMIDTHVAQAFRFTWEIGGSPRYHDPNPSPNHGP